MEDVSTLTVGTSVSVAFHGPEMNVKRGWQRKHQVNNFSFLLLLYIYVAYKVSFRFYADIVYKKNNKKIFL